MYSGDSLLQIAVDFNAALNLAENQVFQKLFFRVKKKLITRSKQAYSQNELNFILDAFLGEWYYFYTAFLIWTGCRPGQSKLPAMISASILL
ncbi:MAG: hypothetical protein F6K40_28020 [Okeania sp. SIO3I5]|uniref:hypothetical protein n=1 Tax=Okeania sp. SIO3I5 TaxID=2607805 RepID=UPI0013B8BFDA|nr:hypothetical protein [Okeania sp. SIO3I5]NEQ39888.1 hypothetical protein [Okeania sp. SIO3I5]